MGKVSIASMLFMSISALVGYGIPVLLYIFFRRRKADPAPFFVGCGVFFIFALLLEQIVHSVVLSSSAGAAIQGNIWFYGIYGGLMAGLFEETGRFLAMKYTLNRYMYKDINSLMYGAGHGGFECIMVFAMTMTNNLVISALINLGALDIILKNVPPEAMSQLEQVITQLTLVPSYQFLIGSFERVFAVLIHLSLSVIVWCSVKYRKNYLYAAAVLMHAAVDCLTVVVQSYSGSILITELCVAVCAVLIVVASNMVFRKNNDLGLSIFDIMSKKELRH